MAHGLAAKRKVSQADVSKSLAQSAANEKPAAAMAKR